MKSHIIEQPADARWVHLSFWLAHLGLALGLFLYVGNLAPDVGVAMFMLGALSFFAYFVFIGVYVNRFGKSGLVWGGMAFITAPVGMWLSYVLGLRLPRAGSRA